MFTKEDGTNRYTQLYIKQITNKSLLGSTQYFVITYKGKNLKKNIYIIYIYMKRKLCHCAYTGI